MTSSNQALIDEIQKEENFISKAKLLYSLKKDKGLRIIDIAHHLNMKPAYICHILRLNKLSEMIIDGYYADLISISHLFVISRLHTKNQMNEVYERVLSGSFTVAQTEELVRSVLYHISSKGKRIKNELLDKTENNLKKNYSEIHMKAIQTRIHSKLIIEIKGSLDETTPVLEEVCKALQSGQD